MLLYSCSEGCNFVNCANLDVTYQFARDNADSIIVAVGEAPEAEQLGDIDDLTLSPSQVTLLRNLTQVCAQKEPEDAVICNFYMLFV